MPVLVGLVKPEGPKFTLPVASGPIVVVEIVPMTSVNALVSLHVEVTATEAGFATDDCTSRVRAWGKLSWRVRLVMSGAEAEAAAAPLGANFSLKPTSSRPGGTRVLVARAFCEL